MWNTLERWLILTSVLINLVPSLRQTPSTELTFTFLFQLNNKLAINIVSILYTSICLNKVLYVVSLIVIAEICGKLSLIMKPGICLKKLEFVREPSSSMLYDDRPMNNFWIFRAFPYNNNQILHFCVRCGEHVCSCPLMAWYSCMPVCVDVQLADVELWTKTAAVRHLACCVNTCCCPSRTTWASHREGCA